MPRTAGIADPDPRQARWADAAAQIENALFDCSTYVPSVDTARVLALLQGEPEELLGIEAAFAQLRSRWGCLENALSLFLGDASLGVAALRLQRARCAVAARAASSSAGGASSASSAGGAVAALSTDARVGGATERERQPHTRGESRSHFTDLEADPTGFRSGELAPDGRLGPLRHKMHALLQRPAYRCDRVWEHGVTAGNSVELLVDGHQIFDRMFEDLAGVETGGFIHVFAYMLVPGPVGERLRQILCERARDGVSVRVIADMQGSSLYPGLSTDPLLADLRAAGVEVEVACIPRPNGYWVEHRKGVVFGHPRRGVRAYFGGANFEAHYLDRIHDCMLRVEGLLALQVQAEFVCAWVTLGGVLDVGLTAAAFDSKYWRESRPTQAPAAQAPAAQAPAAQAPAAQVAGRVVQAVGGLNDEIDSTLLHMLAHAQDNVFLAVPYLTDPRYYDALVRRKRERPACRMRVVVPAVSDWGFTYHAMRALLPRLIEAGIEVYEYPEYFHLKVVRVDDLAWVGTANLTQMSCTWSNELGAVMRGDSLMRQIDSRIVEPDILASQRLTPELLGQRRYQDRGPYQPITWLGRVAARLAAAVARAVGL